MGLELIPEVCEMLLKDVTHSQEIIRLMAAEALAAATSAFPEKLGELLQLFIKLYDELYKVHYIVFTSYNICYNYNILVNYNICYNHNLLASCNVP